MNFREFMYLSISLLIASVVFASDSSHLTLSFWDEDPPTLRLSGVSAAEGLQPSEREFVDYVNRRFRRTLPDIVGEDLQARIVLDYYMEHGIFAAVRAHGVIGAGATDPGRMRGDLIIALGSPEQFASLGDAGAHPGADSGFRYRRDLSFILMTPEIFQSPWTELALLHETWHAYSHAVLGSPYTTEAILNEEAQAHQMEHRLLNNLTGGCYEREMRRLLDTYGLPERNRDFLPAIYMRPLDQCQPGHEPRQRSLEAGIRSFQYRLGFEVMSLVPSASDADTETWQRAYLTSVPDFGR